MNPIIASALASGGAVQVTDVESVFSIGTRTGTGASATITNGINLSGSGGLVIIKQRDGSNTDWAWYDTARGATKDLVSNSSAIETTQATGLTAFNSNGFSIGALAKLNTTNNKYVDLCFRKAPRFFDVVTYVGDGTSSKTIPHTLGSSPGLVIVKRRGGSVFYFPVFSRNLGAGKALQLEGQAGESTIAGFPSAPDSSNIYVGTTNTNTNAGDYVAWIFGHDTSTDGIIVSDSFTVDGSGNAAVNIGWEPQFVMVKASSTTGNWIILDNLRGWDNAVNDASLWVNSVLPESTSTDYGQPTATGFNFKGGTASATYIYLAVRRPNVAPTSGTQVFNAATRTGTGATAVSTAAGFAPDLIITKKRSSTTLTGARFVDRLRGKTIHIDSSSSASEVTTADTITALDSNTGMSIGADATTSAFNTSTHTYVDLFFKRAKGVFDMVSDVGTGSAHTVAHSLGTVPELIIRKGRSGATQWEVYCSALANTEKLVLNSIAAKATDSTAWNSTAPTSSVFTIGTGANVNTNAATYVSFLFATLAGVSKVGSYTGNGSTQNIACGFAAGARFVMIKRTDSSGDWFVWDAVRGIVAGNDPHISLNTTAAEVTTNDSIDPLSSGFTVNQVAATNVNVSSATYIFVAIS